MDKKAKKNYNIYKKNLRLRILTKSILYGISPLIPFLRLFSKEGRNDFFNPEIWRFFYRRERRIGMLNGSIISDSQYIPNDENKDFIFQKQKSGTWIGVDYLRELELGKKSKKISRGIFYSFPLEEVEGNSKEDYTPTFLFNVFEPLHLLRFQKPSLDDLITEEFIEPTAYSHALKKVGKYEKLASRLEIMGISQKEVYQITPKGNGLIFLDSYGGDKEKEIEEETSPLIEKPRFI